MSNTKLKKRRPYMATDNFDYVIYAEFMRIHIDSVVGRMLADLAPQGVVPIRTYLMRINYGY